MTWRTDFKLGFSWLAQHISTKQQFLACRLPLKSALPLLLKLPVETFIQDLQFSGT